MQRTDPIALNKTQESVINDDTASLVTKEAVVQQENTLFGIDLRTLNQRSSNHNRDIRFDSITPPATIPSNAPHNLPPLPSRQSVIAHGKNPQRLFSHGKPTQFHTIENSATRQDDPTAGLLKFNFNS